MTGYGFEFDQANKILLLRFDGQLTEILYVEAYAAAQRHWAATDAQMGIIDFSPVTDIALTNEFLRQLAISEPIGDATKQPRVVVAPSDLQFGLARMFQIMGERTRPLLHVVRTMNEAFATLGVQSPHFDPLQ